MLRLPFAASQSDLIPGALLRSELLTNGCLPQVFQDGPARARSGTRTEGPRDGGCARNVKHPLWVERLQRDRYLATVFGRPGSYMGRCF
jgi:hypothetical protein